MLRITFRSCLRVRNAGQPNPYKSSALEISQIGMLDARRILRIVWISAPRRVSSCWPTASTAADPISNVYRSQFTKSAVVAYAACSSEASCLTCVWSRRSPKNTATAMERRSTLIARSLLGCMSPPLNQGCELGVEMLCQGLMPAGLRGAAIRCEQVLASMR
jgi:hypothetical protein